MIKAIHPPNMKTQTGRLRAARELQFSSMRGAANSFGWNENTYKSHEQGIRRDGALTEADARKYARAFGVAASWLLTGQGDPGHHALRLPNLAVASSRDPELALLAKLEEVQAMLDDIKRSINLTPEQVEAAATARADAASKLGRALARRDAPPPKKT